jgi:hypothetical protein
MHRKQSRCARPASISFNGKPKASALLISFNGKPKASALLGNAVAFGLPLNDFGCGCRPRQDILGRQTAEMQPL